MASADDPSRARFGAAMLDGFAVDVSHQEIERVVVELEELYRSQPGEWLPIAGIGDYLARELGYEDLDEFEDALKSDFAAFVGKLPHVVISRVESELTPGTFRDVFKVTTPAATGGTDDVDGDAEEDQGLGEGQPAAGRPAGTLVLPNAAGGPSLLLKEPHWLW